MTGRGPEIRETCLMKQVLDLLLTSFPPSTQKDAHTRAYTDIQKDADTHQHKYTQNKPPIFCPPPFLQKIKPVARQAVKLLPWEHSPRHSLVE